MDQKEIELFDASAYMLLEASGDSDLAGGYSDSALEVEYSDAVVADVDDAQSCSYGLLTDSTARKRHRDQVIDDDDDDDDDDDCEVVEDDSGGGDEEEDGVVNQCRGAGTGKETNLKKLSNCEESMNSKLMNEGERDKLFWEACLAS